MKNFPNAFVIMICAIVFSWAMTFLVPKGQYERIIDPDSGVTRVVSGSYETIAGDQLSLFDLMLAFPEGIIGRADLIVLILLLGSCFYVIEQTGALGQGLIKLGSLFRGKESLALIALSLVFALGGATIALHEEIIALTPILLIFNRSLGYDRFVTVISSFGAATLGASFSPSNPFGVLIAQEVAELPLISGAGYRMIFLLVAFIAWSAYIVYYANRHKLAVGNTKQIPSKMTINNMIILTMLVITFLISGFGLLSLDWSLNELSGLFFLLGMACGLIGKLGINGTGEAYSQGLKEMAYAAVIIGLANSITLILSKGMIIDTLVEGLFGSLKYLPAQVSALLMLFGHVLLHFPVPSTSGQALMTMPVLVPLSDLIGISRQVCVLAYQYGAGLTDIITPTSGTLVAILAIAGIRYDKWLSFIWRPFLILIAIGAIAIVIGVSTGYQ